MTQAATSSNWSGYAASGGTFTKVSASWVEPTGTCSSGSPSSSSGVLPLTDFGTVSFSGATVNGSAIGNFHPTEIIMVDSAGRDKDTVSSLSGGENFSATWQRSN